MFSHEHLLGRRVSYDYLTKFTWRRPSLFKVGHLYKSYFSGICKAVAKPVSRQRSSPFGDKELAGPKQLWLRGTMCTDIRNAIIAILIPRHMLGVQLLLDVGCGSGRLALALRSERVSGYIGVDISNYAVREA